MTTPKATPDQALAEYIDSLRARIDQAENELSKREDETDKLRIALANASSGTDALRASLAQAESEKMSMDAQLAETERQLAGMRLEYRDLQRENAELRELLGKAFDGLDDYWQDNNPEMSKAIEAAARRSVK